MTGLRFVRCALGALLVTGCMVDAEDGEGVDEAIAVVSQTAGSNGLVVVVTAPKTMPTPCVQCAMTAASTMGVEAGIAAARAAADAAAKAAIAQYAARVKSCGVAFASHNGNVCVRDRALAYVAAEKGVDSCTLLVDLTCNSGSLSNAIAECHTYNDYSCENSYNECVFTGHPLQACLAIRSACQTVGGAAHCTAGTYMTATAKCESAGVGACVDQVNFQEAVADYNAQVCLRDSATAYSSCVAGIR